MPDRERRRLKRLYWNVRLLGLPEPLRDLWMLVITGLLIWALSVQGEQADLAARTGKQTTGALCALRGDLEMRVQSGEAFLREHPHGIPGIPAGTLRTSIDGQRRTIAALSGLDCPHD